MDVSLTPAGLELAELVHAEVAKALGPTLHGLASSEQARLATLLERMLAHP